MKADTFHVRLGDARREAGISLYVLASRAGIARSGLGEMEHPTGVGKVRHPRIDTVERLASALGVSAAWLAYGVREQ